MVDRSVGSAIPPSMMVLLIVIARQLLFLKFFTINRDDGLPHWPAQAHLLQGLQEGAQGEGKIGLSDLDIFVSMLFINCF